MAIKKKETPAGGAPEWLVTYGDMVTLLLTFFVLLLTFMEPKQEDLVQQLMDSLRMEFGYQGGIRSLPTDDDMPVHNLPIAQVLQVPVQPENLSPTREDGPQGDDSTVTNIRKPEYFDKGGKFLFPELSAKLPEIERKRLVAYADKLRGYTTMIEVRGHCNKRPTDGTEFADHYALCYARARAVTDVLLAEGIDPRRILIMVAGTARPITRTAYSIDDREKNDLVEILQRDRTFSEFN